MTRKDWINLAGLAVFVLLPTIAQTVGQPFLVNLFTRFLIYAIAINFVSGVVNKLTPQIPVYFVATPFLIGGGAVLLYWIGDDILALFVAALSQLVGG